MNSKTNLSAARYLFFDIECSNGRDICSFGYCLTDADFNILEQEDILVNPKSKFMLGRPGGPPEIKLSYDKKEFYAAPVFPARYAKIRSLLSAPSITVCGHSVADDVRYVNLACKRYSLPYIDYEFVDTQTLYSRLSGSNQPQSLELICEALGIELGSLHRSDEDAKMSMQTAQKLVLSHDMPFGDLAAAHPDCLGKTVDGIIFCQKFNHYKRYLSRIKTLQSNRAAADNDFKNKRICFSESVEKADVFKMWTLVERLTGLGARYSTRADVAHYFIRDEVKHCRRLKAAESNLGRNRPVILTLSELLDKLAFPLPIEPAAPSVLYDD